MLISKYPTKEEILKIPVSFKDKTHEVIKVWSKKYLPEWKVQNTKWKHMALFALIQGLCKAYDKPCNIQSGDEYAYGTSNGTLYVDKNKASILSVLHEFGHHLYGPSELSACRWSVQLFKISFPKTYESLVWDGHMLKKKHMG